MSVKSPHPLLRFVCRLVRKGMDTDAYLPALRQWLFTGLLVVVPGVITAWVLTWIVGTLDQTLLILPTNWHPDRLLGFHLPGLGAVLTLSVYFAHCGCFCQQFCRTQIGHLGRPHRQPHSCRTRHLFQRQTGVGHPVF